MEIVTLQSEVSDNARSFNEGLENSEHLRNLLSYFRAWYYIPELDMVAPSKYIGYKDINPERFITGQGLDGRETEPVMGKWFDRLNVDTAEGRYVSDKVAELTALYGKSMNRVARFGAPRGWRLSNHSTSQPASRTVSVARQSTSHEIVDVFWRAYLSLYPEDQQALAERILSQRH
jgi:hypothetical protein